MKTMRFFPTALLFLSLSLAAQKGGAVNPPPDGGYPGGNTAEGQNALLSLTTGGQNTAVGFLSLKTDTTGNYNTAIGSGTLLANNADGNTATGTFALLSNTDGALNTANGALALLSNTTGIANTAVGYGALFSNIHSGGNTAVGYYALTCNISGDANTAIGESALDQNSTGGGNTAIGHFALFENASGILNIALGFNAGIETSGNNNIDIGNIGVQGESNTIRIGGDIGQGYGPQTAAFIAGISGAIVPGGAPVIVDTSGHLGTLTSSQRFKDEIRPMDKVSEAVFALEPVTFRYKSELDPQGIPQFGLVAEQVAKVDPDLVARDREGKPYTVRYDAVNSMLLNEFLKEHKKVEKLEATVADLAAQLQKVSAQVQINRSNHRVVVNDD